MRNWQLAIGDCRLRAVAKAVAMVCLPLGAPLLRADEPVTPADSGATRTAANQSVGIEDTPNSEPAVKATPKVDERKPDPPGESASANESGVLLPPRGERRLRTSERSQPTTDGRAGPSALTGLWPLFAVTALIGAVYVFVRRFRGGRLTGSTGAMRVLGRLNLSPRHQVALVQVGQRVLVVGVGAGEMRTLHVVEDVEEAALLAAGAGGGRGDGAFAEWLGREGERFNEVEDEGMVRPKRGASGVTELLKKVRTMQTS